jgi:hypothetical protein
MGLTFACMATLQDVLTEFGGTVRLARALKISPQAVSMWGETIPLLRAYQIAALKPRLFKVDDLPTKPAPNSD